MTDLRCKGSQTGESMCVCAGRLLRFFTHTPNCRRMWPDADEGYRQKVTLEKDEVGHPTDTFLGRPP